MAENQHARFVDATCAVFFGYEIHAVFQRRDQRDFAGTVMREQVATVETAKVIMHRQPVVGGETAVDIAN